MKLYELTESMLRAQDILDAEAFDPATGEIKDPTPELKALLDTIEGAFDDKIENIVKLVKKLKAEAEILKKEEDRMASRRKSREKSAEWLKTYAAQAMDAVDKGKKIKSPLLTIWVQESEGGVEIMERATVPEEFLKPPKPREADKTKLKKALKGGRKIPGIRIGDGKRSQRFR
jgi:hypothetical protein